MPNERVHVLVLAGEPFAGSCAAAVRELGLEPRVAASTRAAEQALAALGESTVAAVVCALDTEDATSCWPLLVQSKQHPCAFWIVKSQRAAASVTMRLKCFDAGAQMVTSSSSAVDTALRRVAFIVRSGGVLACHHCGLGGLTDAALRAHLAFHHATHPNAPNPPGGCPLCHAALGRQPLICHLMQEHGEDREPPPAPFPAFAWVVARRRADGAFLMVNEPAGISGGRPGYWLPAGRMDAGEGFEDAARRECLEEGGVRVTPCGVLRIMADSDDKPSVIRVALLATADDEAAEPKSVPDFESCGALWCDAADLAPLRACDYRSPDPAHLFPAVASGKLRPGPLDTDAWRALEALSRRLTAGDAEALRELRSVWADVRRTYPDLVVCRRGG